MENVAIAKKYHRRGSPLEKLVSLAGQKRELGRTEMEAWQDRYGSLAGQIWELGRTEKKILAVDNLENTTFCQFFYHFYLFSATFGWFLPYFPVFHQFLTVLQPFPCNVCPLAEQFGRVA